MRRAPRLLCLSLASAIAVASAGCRGDVGTAAELEAAVQNSLRLMNAADWATAYQEVLTDEQRATCRLEEYASGEEEGLAAIRDAFGDGEFSIIELETEAVGNVGLVTGTIVYTTALDQQVTGDVTRSALRAQRNLGTATAENPDYWIFEDGGWRWVQRRPESPCYNLADLETIQAATN